MKTSILLASAALAAVLGTHVIVAQAQERAPANSDPTRGPADAPVTVVMFCDFQCPECGRSGEAVSVVLGRRSDVRLVYRDFPIDHTHPFAALAAEAAACAQDQGRYWQMWDRLYANQQSLDGPSLRRHARAVGLNGTLFDECLASGRHRAEWQEDRKEGLEAGVTGTPAFFINGQKFEGEMTADELEQLIAGAGR
ncbi:MAG: DsbA family protein [bacterium]